MQDRRSRADVLFIRTQSTIRADGPPSAQVRALQLDVLLYVDQWRGSSNCALRAPTLVLVRMKSASVPKPRLLKKRQQRSGLGSYPKMVPAFTRRHDSFD
jgi:hypothetical protein